MYLAVIADDLTGANDTGVQFAKYGLQTHVMLNIGSFDVLPQNAEVLVLDTDSRAIAPQAAYERVRTAAQFLSRSGVSAVYKKVDSTLRGNLGSEIDAALEALHFPLAIIAPAFPQTGRITVGGYHLLNGVPLEATEVAQDLKSPVAESRLPMLLAGQSRFRVGRVELHDILAGQAAVIARLNAAVTGGTRLVAFDTTDAAHLLTIAQAVKDWGKPVLWVGSAGLAGVLPQVYDWRGAGPMNKQEGKRGLPVLVVAGSLSSVTAKQVDTFLARSGAWKVQADAARLIEAPAAEVTRCIAAAKDPLQNKQDVVLVAAADLKSVAGAKAAGEKRGLSLVEVSNQIAAQLGIITQALVKIDIAGLFLTGGDTAVSVCQNLGANSMQVFAEVAPGIPLGAISSGPYNRLKVVTKAGAFGDEETIVKAVELIHGRS